MLNIVQLTPLDQSN